MIDTKSLRIKAIDLAVQGKLTERLPEDGTAVELHQRIQKAKGISPTTKKGDEAEAPFDIPSSWKWIRLNEITTSQTLNDGDWVLSQDMVAEGPVKLIQLGSIGDLQYRNKGFKYLTEKHFVELNCNQIYPGYLLINRIVSNRMMLCIIPEIKGILITAVDACWVAPDNEAYNIKYIMYALSSSSVQSKVKELGHGVTRFRISKLNLVDISFPFPPLAEQSRIVEKIESIFSILDTIDTLQSQYQDNLATLKSKIIDAGIQGKLTEQLPEDGTAEELYQQIQQEKLALEKAGKIKKSKPLPPISDEEKPFDIPDNWKWVRFSEIVDVRDGTHDTPKYVKEGVPLITSKNLSNGEIDFETAKLISHEDATSINLRSAVDDGDILLAMIGTIGNPVLVKKSQEFSIKNIALFKPISKQLFDMEYFLFFLQKEQYILKNIARGGLQPFVSLKLLREYLFPLPPLAEQKRIVAKLEELLPLCEG